MHNFFATGHEADARASGWIDPRRPLGRSVLDLNGRILPHAVFLSKLEKDYPGLPALAGDVAKSGVFFKIDGVLDQPGYALK
ncbi:MAG: hypothetical protein GY859_41830 [Desulfobacterales bacterium]|nr:hypothetical protein [Desulfobacterales bacterium]